MHKPAILLAAILCYIAAISQSKKSIEVSFTGRYDQHADYVSRFANRSYNDTNKLYGISYGAGVSFRKSITSKFSVSVGAGYYRLGIDKIRGSMPFNIPGTRTARNINYEDGITNLLYSTSRYHYNNLSVILGINRTLPIKEGLSVDIGAEGIVYYSFSQRYRLFNGPNYYSTTNTKPLEFGANLTFGIVKSFNRFYLRPALLLPVYQNLKGDRVFYEDRNMNIPKWFHGIGLMLRAGKWL